jgi:hypothetical protein
MPNPNNPNSSSYLGSGNNNYRRNSTGGKVFGLFGKGNFNHAKIFPGLNKRKQKPTKFYIDFFHFFSFSNINSWLKFWLWSKS